MFLNVFDQCSPAEDSYLGDDSANTLFYIETHGRRNMRKPKKKADAEKFESLSS